MITTIKSWGQLWIETAKTLIRHPILTTKGFIVDFLAADIKGKLKKVGLLIAFIIGLRIAVFIVMFAICLILVLGMVDGSYEAHPERYYYDEVEGCWRRRHY